MGKTERSVIPYPVTSRLPPRYRQADEISSGLDANSAPFATPSADERQDRRGEKAEGEERGADRPQPDAEPHERSDLGDDGGGRQHDGDLGQAASEFIMSEPAIGQFPSFRGLLGAVLNRIQAVFPLFR